MGKFEALHSEKFKIFFFLGIFHFYKVLIQNSGLNRLRGLMFKKESLFVFPTFIIIKTIQTQGCQNSLSENNFRYDIFLIFITLDCFSFSIFCVCIYVHTSYISFDVHS